MRSSLVLPGAALFLLGALTLVSMPAVGGNEPTSGTGTASSTPTIPPFPDGLLPRFDPPIRTPDPGAMALLLAHIPESVREACESRAVQFELAAVICRPSTDVRLGYRFLEPYGVGAAFSWARTFAAEYGTMPGNGTCREGGYLGTWPEAGGEPTGELLCYEHKGVANIVWSHEASNIIAYLDGPGADHAAAYDLWLTAGPS